MIPVEAVDAFTEFVGEVEPRLHHALIAAVGVEAARESTAEALAYAWEHWEKVGSMENPAGYLYRLAANRARRSLRHRRPLLPPVPPDDELLVEPGLPEALARLTRHQRSVVWLIHGLGWKPVEVARLLDLSESTVQTHSRRGLAKLRNALGVETLRGVSGGPS
jgi:DNA-directed RNA polymerase specialized sigma24 family protein